MAFAAALSCCHKLLRRCRHGSNSPAKMSMQGHPLRHAWCHHFVPLACMKHAWALGNHIPSNHIGASNQTHISCLQSGAKNKDNRTAAAVELANALAHCEHVAHQMRIDMRLSLVTAPAQIVELGYLRCRRLMYSWNVGAQRLEPHRHHR
jgi:hypothetical protein